MSDGVDDDPRARLLLVAERVCGAEGIDTASLRKIAAQAGNGNNNAVKYHFGTRGGLVEAIIQHRVGQMEPLRQRLLGEAEKNAKLADLPTLMSIYCLPQLSLVDTDGRYPYAAFLLQYFHRQTAEAYSEAISHVVAVSPIVERTRKLLLAAMDLKSPQAEDRLALAHMMFLNMLVRLGNDAGGDQQRRMAVVHDTMAMVVAALAADPVRAVTTRVDPAVLDGMVLPRAAAQPSSSQTLVNENDELRRIVAQLSLDKHRLEQALAKRPPCR